MPKLIKLGFLGWFQSVPWLHRWLFPSHLVTSPLTLDTNTAHPLLSISDDLRSVARVKQRLPYAAHPERFDHWPQVLTGQTFSSGTHYWELEAEGFWDIGVCYRSIGRKGKEGNAFGINKVLTDTANFYDVIHSFL